MSRLTIYLALSLTFFCGCASEIEPDQLRASESSYQNAKQLVEAGNYEEAEREFLAAIEGGGLNADFLADAYLQRARCLAELGRYDEAHEALDVAAQGAELDKWHVARALVYRKQGEEGKSQAEMEQAIAINPEIELGVD